MQKFSLTDNLNLKKYVLTNRKQVGIHRADIDVQLSVSEKENMLNYI